MPLYQYECKQHGGFEHYTSLEKCRLPVDCPVCNEASIRAYTSPRLRQIDKQKASAMDRNEKSKHQPHVCGRGCSHGHSHSSPKKKKQEGALQRYNGARPWVIEHA